MASYKVVVIDLSVERDVSSKGEVIPKNTLVEDVAVVAMSPGVAASLLFGTKQDAIPIQYGMTFTICPGENDGIFITNPAQPGATVNIAVGFGLTSKP